MRCSRLECRSLRFQRRIPSREKLAEEYLRGLDEVLVLEELDPMVERELLRVAGRHHLPVKIFGKLTGHTRNAGENSTESIRADLEKFLCGDDCG